MPELEALGECNAGRVREFAERVAGSEAERVAIITPSGELIEARNVSPKPAAAFLVGPEEWAELEPEAAVLVHSHALPGPVSCIPSELDQRAQIAQGIPWAVVCPDGSAFSMGVDDPRPLAGRGFRFGSDDCFALFRDAWRAWSGAPLPNYPRRWRWWADGEPLIERGLALSGFHAVPDEEMQRGDGLLFKLRADVFNHVAFVASPEKMLHHPGPAKPVDGSQASRLESIERWLALLPHQVIRAEVSA